MKKFLTLFVLLCICLSSVACLSSCSSKAEGTINVDGNIYRLNDDGQTYTFSSVASEYAEETFTVPASITENNYKVTAIGYQAFTGNQNIKKVILPESIVTVGESAFYECTSLKAVQFSENTTEIGGRAFAYCSALESIQLPAITVIKYSMFEGCESLTDIRIPDTVTAIDDSAFLGCEKLESITIPSSVQTIGINAFVKCKALKKVNLSEGLQTICNDAFGNCYSLKEITIPNSVQKIAKGAWGDSELTDITYKGTKARWSEINEGGLPVVFDYTVHCSDGNIEG